MRPEIQHWIDKQYLLRHDTNLSGTYWIATLDDDDGQPCIRFHALNFTKKAGMRYREVFRDYLDGKKYVRGDLIFTQLGGWRVAWEEPKKDYRYYGYSPDDRWYECDRRPGFGYNETYTLKEINDLFSKYIPYFQLREEINYKSLMEYAQRYRDYASAELLVKAGLDHLVMDKRALKLKGEGKKRFLRWLKTEGNLEYVRDHKSNYNEILRAIKRGLSIERFYYEECIDAYERTFKEARIHRTRKQCEEVYKYLNHPKKVQQIGLVDYVDYLRIAKEEGYNMRLKSTVYPRDARLAHDTLVERRVVKQNRVINQKLRKIASLLKTYELSKNDFKIVFPRSQADFISWGKDLSICVGSYGYYKKMAKGESIILGVFMKNEIIECCEIGKFEKKKLSIIQLRGKNNQDSPYHHEVKTLVEKFLATYKPQNLMGAVI